MHGRLGNGMILWLGAALLAHAALLALPGSESGGSAVPAGGLKVRMAPAAVAPVRPATPSQHMPTAHPDQAAATALEPAPRPPSKAAPERPAEPEVTRIASSNAQDDTPLAAPRREAPETRPIATRSVDNKAPPPAPQAASNPVAVASVEHSPAPAPIEAVNPASRGTPIEPPAQFAAASDTASSIASAAVAARPDDRMAILIHRLHEVIEREKRYPLSARRLGREGTASVAFRLRPDGAIDGLQVASSSGEPALDRAALRAVAGISPFGEAGDYLDETAPFRIDIAFRLR